MRAPRNVGIVLLIGTSAVVAGSVRCAAVHRLRHDSAALLRLDSLPSVERLAHPPGFVGFAVANDSRLVAMARAQLPGWIENFKPLGSGKLANVVGLTLLGGGLTHGDRRAVIGGLTLLEGNAFAGVAVDAVKEAFGRVRPNHPGPGRWFAGGDSFPSSHSTHAFLTAAVLEATFDEPEWRGIFPALAACVALQRLHEGVHYPTDVLAGGALGSWIGRRLSVAHGLAAPPRPAMGARVRSAPTTRLRSSAAVSR